MQTRLGPLARPVSLAHPSVYPHLGALRLMATERSEQVRKAQLQAQKERFRIKNQSAVLYFASAVRIEWMARMKH